MKKIIRQAIQDIEQEDLIILLTPLLGMPIIWLMAVFR